MWYRSGSISVTSGSTSVTGVGTNWIDGAGVGEAMWGPDGRLYEIANITSATSLTLGSGYQGATVTGGTYQIVPTQSYIRDLAAQAATLVADYGSIMSAAGQGKFGDGTVTQPGLRFTADENTGIRRVSADTMALVAGGADVVQVTSSGVTVPALAYTGTLTGGTGVVNIGSGQFYKDASGAVGIGTAAPNSKLHIVGDVGVAKRSVFVKPTNEPAAIDSVRTFAIERSGNDSALAFGYSTTRDAFVVSSTYGSTGAYKPLVLATSDQDRVTIDASGAVGIGTASPATNLHVKGAANGWLTLQRGNDASNIAWQSWANADGSNKWGLGMLNSSNNLSVFNYSTGDVAGVFDSAGNFGLGVTPSAWNTASYKVFEMPFGCSLFAQTDAPVLTMQSNAYVNAAYAETYKTTAAAAKYRQINGAHQWYTAPSGTAGNPISFTQAMTLDASGNLLVGAAGSTYATKLAVKGAGDGVTSSQISVQAASGDSKILLEASGGATSAISGGDVLKFYVSGGNTERARIDSAGNFGIGTASPTAPLTIQKAGNTGIALRQNTTVDRFRMFVGDGTGGHVADDNYIVSNSTALRFRNNLSSDSMMLDVAGNFGLGVTPSAWGSGFKALEVGRAGSGLFSVGATSMQVTCNYYYNGSNYIYASNGSAARYHLVDGQHQWFTAPSGTAGNPISFTQAMTLDTSGNLLVGTTSAAEKITVNGAIAVTGGITGHGANRVTISQEGPSNGAFIQSYGPNTSTAGEFNFRQASSDFSVNRVAAKIDTSGNLIVGGASAGAAGATTLYENGNILSLFGSGTGGNVHLGAISGVSNGFQVIADTSNNLTYTWATGGAERARIDSSGNLLVGDNTGDFRILAKRASAGTVLGLWNTAENATQIAFHNTGGSAVGSVSVTSSTTAYNTSSDARLKENIAAADNGSVLIDQLQVRKFDWKADGSHQRYGFVAQELDAVFPEAVSKPADPQQMMGVDYSKLVPLLVQEVQSLRARLAALEAA